MDLLIETIPHAVVFLYGCLGELITEKAGHLNLGIPGIMCAGCAGGCWGASIYMSMCSEPSAAMWLPLVLMTLLFSVLVSGAVGLLYALFTVTLRCNQNITGLALTTFGAGFSEFFMNRVVDKSMLYNAGIVIKKCLPFAQEFTGIGKLIFGYGIFVYLSIAIAVALHFFLKKTKAGLNLRAIGESPATADAVGINVTGYKYAAITIGSAIAGLGGMFYTLDSSSGSFDNTIALQGFGWLAIALVIFTLWKPLLSMIGSFVFGFLYTLPSAIVFPNTASSEAFYMIPYVITVVILIITSITGSKLVQPPASLGLNYFREDR